MTMRIAVTDIVDLPNDAAFFQLFSDALVTFPNILAFPITLGEKSIFVNNVHNGNIVSLSEIKVLLTVCRRNMDNARTILSRHISS